ncbi:MAG: anhydro-N-acetylmuramic acid kinase [Bacteroidota bacterium]
MKKYNVIGVMSGTSLDGLDLAYCTFGKRNKKNTTTNSFSGEWEYKIHQAKTLRYSSYWKNKLMYAHKLSSQKLTLFDREYGYFIGEEIKKFILQNHLHPNFVSSHGHTIFHQPEKKVTLQIGNGATISEVCGLPVVCDFRTGDVALGGQGAPLVPIADKLLFSEYTFCLNLGGFANISYDNKKRNRVAFDICPANIVLNYLSSLAGKEFDRDGKMAARGKINLSLFNKLNSISFYKKEPPKSLGREWVEKNIFPILNSHKIPIKDKLCTFCEHIAFQISKIINLPHTTHHSLILVTGGGALNKFLMKRIIKNGKIKIKIPEQKIIKYKEAVAFSFLGVLRIRNEINILKSVTGAERDSIGGTLYET